MPFGDKLASPVMKYLCLLAAVASLTGNCSVAIAGDTATDSKSVRAAKKTMTGKATYYGRSFDGNPTKNGETFDHREHTAASNVLPLGSEAKVTNLQNGKSVKVKVNDTGPALGRKKIDLTTAAARKIGITHKQGTAPVKIEVTKLPPRDDD
jgi:rare lipoprotein A